MFYREKEVLKKTKSTKPEKSKETSSKTPSVPTPPPPPETPSVTAPPPETKTKKPRNHKLKIRLEGEPLIATMEGSPSEEQIKPIEHHQSENNNKNQKLKKHQQRKLKSLNKIKKTI